MGYQCPVCSKDFGIDQKLFDQHLSSAHSGLGKDLKDLFIISNLVGFPDLQGLKSSTHPPLFKPSTINPVIHGGDKINPSLTPGFSPQKGKKLSKTPPKITTDAFKNPKSRNCTIKNLDGYLFDLLVHANRLGLEEKQITEILYSFGLSAPHLDFITAPSQPKPQTKNDNENLILRLEIVAGELEDLKRFPMEATVREAMDVLNKLPAPSPPGVKK